MVFEALKNKLDKASVERELKNATEKMNLVLAEEKRIVDEKNSKLHTRQKLEHQQVTRQQMFHSMSPLSVRLMFFYTWLSKNMGLVTQKEIDTYIVNARLKKYFDSLEDVEGPEPQLKFTEDNDQVAQ